MSVPRPSTNILVEVAAACLLTALGGFMDAYGYVDRCGVSANAQTGNVVLRGIHLARRGDDTRTL